MNDKTWELIDAQFKRWPNTKAMALGAEEFDKEMQLWIGTIDPDYREFVLRHGGATVGSRPVYGLRQAAAMGTIGGKGTATEITKFFKSHNWRGVENWLIFSVDHGGNPIGFSNDGTVWLSDQTDFRQIVQLADGFEDYILKWCLEVKEVEDY